MDGLLKTLANDIVSIKESVDSVKVMVSNLIELRVDRAIPVVGRRSRGLKRAPNKCRPEILEQVREVLSKGMNHFRGKDLCDMIYGGLFDRKDQIQVSAALVFLGFEKYRSTVVVDGVRHDMWRKQPAAELDRDQKRVEERTAQASNPLLDYDMSLGFEERVKAAVGRHNGEVVVSEFGPAVMGRKIDAAENVKIRKVLHKMGMYEVVEGGVKVWKMPPGLAESAPMAVGSGPVWATAVPVKFTDPNVPAELRAEVERLVVAGGVSRFSLRDLAANMFPDRESTLEERQQIRTVLEENDYREVVDPKDGRIRSWYAVGDTGEVA